MATKQQLTEKKEESPLKYYSPLEFWFNRSPKDRETIDQIIERLCKEDEKFKDIYDKVVNMYIRIIYPSTVLFRSISETLEEEKRRNNEEFLRDLYSVYNELDYIEQKARNERGKNMGLAISPTLPHVFEEYYKKFYYEIKKHDPHPFYEKLMIFLQENVNGYMLYNSEGEMFSKDDFYELKSIWENNKQYTYSEFYDKYNNSTCTEWHKFDRNGEYYKGFYKTMDHDEAWKLTFEDNCLGLWELPYPKEVILKTISHSCSRGIESVRYCNFLCEWIKRKINQVDNKSRSLTSFCISTVKKYSLDTKDLAQDLKDMFIT